MPGLVPGIHVFCASSEDMDGRDKPGHGDSFSFDVTAPCRSALPPSLRKRGAIFWSRWIRIPAFAGMTVF